MSGWETATTAAAGNQEWDSGAASASGWNDGGGNNMATNGDDGFGANTGGDENPSGGNDGACRNCGQDGHMARECPEPRKMGACFNCGEEGHSKADCTKPRVFKGECRNCNQEGHMDIDCPTRVDKCKNCLQEGHVALDCKNPKTIDNANVAEKSEDEAWALLKQASDERDIGDFKEAVLILSKTCPDYTYPKLEKEFRARKYTIYMIAMEKDHEAAGMETWTNVNLQGDVGKKFAVSYFTTDKAQRPALLDKWPASAEENLTRLADAGTPLDRGVEKCSNCNKLGHVARRCPDERMASVQPVVTCFLCGEEGHRVRDCGQERRKPGRACKTCESEDHIAKDCPDRVKSTCRNCGEEDHMAKDCPNPRKVVCNNCDEEGHMRAECTKPKKKINWAEVTCSVCSQKGHGRFRCPQAPEQQSKTGGGDPGDADMDTADTGAATGGWDAPVNTGSAPSEWESAQPNDAFGGPAAATGGGW